MKQCIKCSEYKDFNSFCKNKLKKDGLHCYCKDCQKIIRKNIDKKYHGSIKGKIARANATKKYQSRDDIKEKRRISRQNPNRKLKEHLYRKNLRKTNHLFRVLSNLRTRLGTYLKLKNFNKEHKFSKAVGCSYKELKLYLENQFTLQMTWDNYGLFWEIDHIIPLCSAKTEEDLYKLTHYTNLQPLLVKDNRSKSGKIYAKQ